jgi:DNA-binding GntR family transcriptional regulator
MRTDMKIEQPKSLTEMVMARLEQAIVDGEFGLGEAISEETLAKTFGVSRTPVRDALTALQRAGLVVVLPKRGSFVFKPSAADTAALCAYRFLLECEGIRLSHVAAPEETRLAMHVAICAMETSLTEDAVAYGRADTQFHQAFLDHCGNPYLAEAYRLASGKVAAPTSPPMSRHAAPIPSTSTGVWRHFSMPVISRPCSLCWPSTSTAPGRSMRLRSPHLNPVHAGWP